MSDKKPSQKSSRRGSNKKPRVKSFLRQASAIIASEKGLNAASQQKLQTLAEYLKMPQEEFHEALSLLQENEKLPTGLNRYEKDFVSFLRQEFKQLNGGIMTVTMENKAIDLAARKYDILEPRARKLIHDQAEAMGIGRISHGEAESYVESLIVSRIGDSTRIDEATRERLFQIAAKWGVGNEHVDAIVLHAIGENRKQEIEERGTSGKTWITIVLFLLLVTTGAVFTIYANGWFAKKEPLEEPGPAELVANSGDDQQPPLVMPSWWHAHDLERLVEGLQAKELNEGWIRLLAAENLELREQGLDELLSLAAIRNGDDLRDLQELLANYFYACPEQGFANKLLSKVNEQLDLPASKVPSKTEKMKVIFGANRTLGKLNFFAPSKIRDDFAKRKSQVLQAISGEFGNVSFGDDLNSYLKTTDRVIAINQWNHLIQTSWASPNRTALLIGPQFELTQSRLQKPELNRLHRRTVMSVLESDQTLWFDLKGEISRAISASPENTIITWINHYQTVFDKDYQEWLGLELVDHCGLELPSTTMAEVARALENVKTGNRRQQFRELIARNEKLDVLTEQLLNNYRTSGGSPQLIADVARAVNLNMFLSPMDQSSFQLESFDLLYRRGAPNLASLARKSLQAEQVGQGGTATRSDFNQVIETIKKLGSLDGNQRDSRLNSLKRLAEVSVRFNDFSYANAEVLAEYYLEIVSDRERVQAEKLLPRFVRLPSFGLAISQRIGTSNATLDQALTIAQYYAKDSFELEDAARWRGEIGRFVFDSVVERMDEATNQVTDDSLRWQFLRANYRELSFQRLTTLGAKGLEKSSSPVESARAIVRQLLSRTPGGIEYPVDRAVEVLQIQSGGELVELVALNKLQIKLLAQQIIAQWPQRARQVNEIVVALQSRGKMTSSNLFLETELALLRLWTLERQAIVERLLAR